EVQGAGRDDLGARVVADRLDGVAGVPDRHGQDGEQRRDRGQAEHHVDADAARDRAEPPAARERPQAPPAGPLRLGGPAGGRGGRERRQARPAGPLRIGGPAGGRGGRRSRPRRRAAGRGHRHGGPSCRSSVIVVQAPTWTRSPSVTGTGRFTSMGSVPPFSVVPLVEPGSTRCQPPSGCARRTACRWETPGSSGGALRSISGRIARDVLRRPIRIWSPISGTRRSGQYGGNVRRAASGPICAITVSKY